VILNKFSVRGLYSFRTRQKRTGRSFSWQIFTFFEICVRCGWFYRIMRLRSSLPVSNGIPQYKHISVSLFVTQVHICNTISFSVCVGEWSV